MYFGVFSPMRTPCDGYHKEFEFISVQSWAYLYHKGLVCVGFDGKTICILAPVVASEKDLVLNCERDWDSTGLIFGTVVSRVSRKTFRE